MQYCMCQIKCVLRPGAHFLWGRYTYGPRVDISVSGRLCYTEQIYNNIIVYFDDVLAQHIVYIVIVHIGRFVLISCD